VDTPADVRKLEDLLEVSQTLAATLELRAALPHVLDTLSRHHGARSSMVLLFDAETGDLSVEAASGLTPAGVRAARYKPGEGITGRVAQSGRPVVVPQASREPLFLNRTGVLPRRGQADLSYICVPIRSERRVAGALRPLHTPRASSAGNAPASATYSASWL
jgi:Nif-specific regulatory protein